jgi:hypothetical protein
MSHSPSGGDELRSMYIELGGVDNRRSRLLSIPFDPWLHRGTPFAAISTTKVLGRINEMEGDRALFSVHS